MTSYTRVAAVTGANKGIGLAIVRQLALQYPKSSFNNGPLLIYLTARNEERGKAALESINYDAQLKKAKALRSQGGLTDIRYLPLDIDSQDSIKSFAATIKKEHPDGIDILVNNAGIAGQGFDINVVKTTLHCNYYGTLTATQLLLPQIREGGRLVNVASIGGKLASKYSPNVKSRFLNTKTVEDATKLIEEFTSAVSNGTYKSDWPQQAYSVSKAGVIAFTKVLGDEYEKKGSKTCINSCCPGYVNTDMTKGNGVKTPDEGAQTPAMLALGEIKTGNAARFWEREKPCSWENER